MVEMGRVGGGVMTYIVDFWFRVLGKGFRV